MYTTTQIEAIKIFGNKELTYGCLVKADGDFIKIDSLYTVNIKNNTVSYCDEIGCFSFEIYEILGHIPTLEDVFRLAEEKGVQCSLEISIYTEKLKLFLDDISMEYNPTIPVLDQSEETLQQLISLFK